MHPAHARRHDSGRFKPPSPRRARLSPARAPERVIQFYEKKTTKTWKSGHASPSQW